MKKILRFSAGCFLLLHLNIFSQTFTDSNLPIVVISTGGQDLDSAYNDIWVWMGIIDNGPNRNYLSDPFNGYNGLIEIKLHGSSTLMFPKKSFRIETINSSGQEIDVSLLGMPSDNDWIFKALYQDKTFLRDALAFRIHTQMGHYSSRTRFFELIVDGDYRGVYQLEERVKRSDYRVDIASLTPSEISGDDLTGGYIIRLDRPDWNDDGWYSYYPSNATSDSSNFFLYYYPKPDSIVWQQKDYIKNYFDKFEDVLNSSYWNNPDSGYSNYINMESFIDNFIINEFARNVDGYRLSSYFYKDKDSRGDKKLHCGPVWDYNIAWKNAYYNGGNNFWGWQYQQYAYDNFVPFWWGQLASDSWFQNELQCRYMYLRTNCLSETALFDWVDLMADSLDESQQRNFTRWPIMGQYVWPNPTPVPSDYPGEISLLKNFMQQRLGWLDSNIPGTCSSVAVQSSTQNNSFSVYPNPFSNYINVILSETNSSQLTLFNLLGEEVGKWQLSSGKNQINLQNLTSGIYIVRVTSNLQEIFGEKLVKVGG